MEKLPISLVLVVYDEDWLLERALKSAHDIVDEIIIVYDGKCIDNSKEIAKKYEAKFFERKHYGAAEFHRKFTYEKAKNEWIMQLDADEFLSEELKKVVPDIIKDNEYEIINVQWPRINRGKMYFGYYKTFLFKKSKVYILSIPHEYAKPINENIKIKKISQILMHIQKSDILTLKTLKTKTIKWAKLAAECLGKDIKKVEKYNYPYNDWDYYNKIRVKHPILFGIIGSCVYHTLISIFNTVRYRSFYYIKENIFICIHFIVMYYIVLKNKMPNPLKSWHNY